MVQPMMIDHGAFSQPEVAPHPLDLAFGFCEPEILSGYQRDLFVQGFPISGACVEAAGPEPLGIRAI